MNRNENPQRPSTNRPPDAIRPHMARSAILPTFPNPPTLTIEVLSEDLSPRYISVSVPSFIEAGGALLHYGPFASHIGTR
jgi:hypothetical protein